VNRYSFIYLLGAGALGLTSFWRGNLVPALLALSAAACMPAQHVLAAVEPRGALSTAAYLACLTALAGYAAMFNADTISRLLAAAVIVALVFEREAAFAAQHTA